MFKVVTDQLKVSQGWVRCGRCAEVFDAAALLLPAETATEPRLSGLTSDDLPALERASQSQKPETLTPVPSHPTQATSEPDDASPDSAADFDPASWKQARQERHQQDAEALQPDAAPVNTPPHRPELVHTATVDESDAEPSELADTEVEEAVSFVREAQRKAFWKKPRARWSLGVLSLLLLVALTLQWVMQQKDDLAALEPRFAPLLQTICGHLGCEIRSPRHIESLVIESSTFNKIGLEIYRLSFVFKNTGELPLEIPSLEVALTDAQDQVVVRRVLAPLQFGTSPGRLAAHSELAGAVTMKVSGDASPAGSSSQASSTAPGPSRIAGYRLFAFYP